MAADPTSVPRAKYRRLQIIAYVLVAAVLALAVALFMQMSRSGSPDASDAKNSIGASESAAVDDAAAGDAAAGAAASGDAVPEEADAGEAADAGDRTSPAAGADAGGADAADAAGADASGADASGADSATYVRQQADDPTAIGDADAPIVMSLWTDLRCPFCASFNRDTMPQLVQEYVDSGKVRIEVNEVAFFGDDSVAAAVAARAAGNQGRYFEFLRTAYAAAPASGHPEMPRAKLVGFAKDAGVADIDRFERDLDDADLVAEVRGATARAQQLGVTGVPFFAINATAGDGGGINGSAFSGAQPMEQFRNFLDGALEKAGA